MIKVWEQEVCSSCDLRFEPYGYSFKTQPGDLVAGLAGLIFFKKTKLNKIQLICGRVLTGFFRVNPPSHTRVFPSFVFSTWPNSNPGTPGSRVDLSSRVSKLCPWLLIWWSLKAYMVVNFRTREISWGTHKLARTPTLIKKD